MENTIELVEFISEFNEKYKEHFDGYNLVCELNYMATRFSNNKHVNFDSGTLAKISRSTKVMKCLTYANASIGFYSKDGLSFYTLMNIHPTTTPENTYHYHYNRNVTSGSFLYGKMFKIVKGRMLKRLFCEVQALNLKGVKIVCSGIYPAISTEVKTMYKVIKNEKEYNVENFINFEPPFFVEKKYISFVPPANSGETFEYEIGKEAIMSVIKNKYKDVEKNFGKIFLKKIYF